MSSIKERLEKERRELLDLSLRNTLLNFRPLRTKGVQITDELSDQIFRILVSTGASMTFLPAPAEPEAKAPLDLGISELIFHQPDEEPPPEEDETGKPAARHVDKRLQTPHSDTRLQRRLLNSYYASRNSIEEHGINTLYLALGFLQWYEAESSDEERTAPLVLVPVTLDRKSAQSRFRVKYSGDDLGTNLSLQEKLRREHGLQLPEFEAADDRGVAQYLESVQKLVSKLPRWRVEPNEIHLGFFSFTKLLMYKDLDPGSWPQDSHPADHPVLSAVLGSGFQDSTPKFVDAEPLDTVLPPQDSTHIWDADSSQALALLEVSGGRSLVIQGPPGTGKSQTITNLTADSVSAGKKVLFVAEKMAALEVVKRRLDNAFVGDMCLELHSHKSNKASVLEDLKRTLYLGAPKASKHANQIQELESALQRLNAYCRELHRPVPGAETTPYQAYGALLRIRRETDGVDMPDLNNENLCKWPRTLFRERLDQVRQFKAVLGAVGVPIEHLFWGSEASLYLPEMAPELQSHATQALQALGRFEDSAGGLARELGLERPMSIAEADRRIEPARRAAAAPSLSGVAVKESAWDSRRDDIETSIKQGRTLAELHSEHDSILLPESWAADVLETRKRYQQLGSKWWRMLLGQFRTARKHFLGLVRETPPKPNQARLALLDDILEAQRLARDLSKREDLLRSLLGAHWKGFESDFSRLQEITEYLVELHDAIANAGAPAALLDYLSAPHDTHTLTQRIQQVETTRTELVTVLEAAWTVAEFSPEKRWQSRVEDVPFTDLDALFTNWQRQPELLREMTQFNTWAEELDKQELGDFVRVCSSWDGAAEHADRLLEHAWYSGVLRDALRERADLSAFDGGVHSKTLERFRQLDEWLLERNRVRLARQHFDGLPRNAAGGQVAILKREFEKKRRHKKIRQLLAEAGRAIQQIKPVFMMSPLSVAAYLPQAGIEFDLVVFDEASQVTPVDAYGALLRAEQAIVVGDSKQLPPTPFFNKVAEDEEQEEELGSDLESILGLFEASSAPSAMLRWHYRSQHESLIAVSNHEFYGEGLAVFPSPDQTRSTLGLIFRHVEGTFLRGRGRSYNPREARAVAEAVMRHAKEHPHLTLGVAAFSQRQSREIQDQIELLRREHPELEGFFSSHPEEPFFVKNLENVQGDERDVIFISIGYGRDENGQVSHNFGPLNQDGGERRLNVLITRAKKRCEIFTNMTADDIDLSKSNRRGVKALKSFLQYARDGQLDVPTPTDRGAESEFEVEVAYELQNLGYEIDSQVGSGGFFVDLAVKDNRAPGRYLLGIECDGATYHSAKWARDRDRLRQEVLERLGWKIHRIWSTDWFMNRDREIRKVQQAIETARTLSTSPPVPKHEPPAASGPTLERSEPAAPEVAEQIAPPYKMATIQGVSHERKRLYNQPPSVLAPQVEAIVEVEGPVHRSLVVVRIAATAGLNAVHKRSRAAVEKGIRMAVRSGTVSMRGDFLWKRGRKASVRDWSVLPVAQRKIEYIPPEEISLAVKRVIEAGISMPREEAAQLAGRLLGYQRVSEQIREVIEGQITRMIRDGLLRESAGEVTC